MRISYYGYYLRNKLTYDRHLVDLSKFVKSFARCTEPLIKGSIRENDEHLYLGDLSGSLCVLAKTRDSEKFKRIDTSKMSMGEFNSVLGQDEKVGFASYVVVKEHFFGFASSSLSPKFDAFSYLVNAILSITGNGSWEFCVHPLIHQATRDEAVEMNFIGETTIEVKTDNTLAKHILNVLKAEDGLSEVDSLTIKIKPAKRKNIKPVIEKILDHTSDEGLTKLVMKAKNDLRSSLLDLYVVGKGVISDSLTDQDENSIAISIEEKIQKNEELKKRLQEFMSSGKINQADFNSILHYSTVDAWTTVALDLQKDFQLRP